MVCVFFLPFFDPCLPRIHCIVWFGGLVSFLLTAPTIALVTTPPPRVAAPLRRCMTPSATSSSRAPDPTSALASSITRGLSRGEKEPWTAYYPSLPYRCFGVCYSFPAAAAVVVGCGLWLVVVCLFIWIHRSTLLVCVSHQIDSTHVSSPRL